MLTRLSTRAEDEERPDVGLPAVVEYLGDGDARVPSHILGRRRLVEDLLAGNRVPWGQGSRTMRSRSEDGSWSSSSRRIL